MSKEPDAARSQRRATGASATGTAEVAPPGGTPPPSGPPAVEPIGRALTSAAKQLERAFGQHMAEAGGSQPVWLILLALKQQPWRTQQELAAAVGVEGPTLTYHLDGLEKSGLISRARDPEDRRAVRVELTDAGGALFLKLASAAVAWDQRLRADIDDDDLEAFRRVLERLRQNSK